MAAETNTKMEKEATRPLKKRKADASPVEEWTVDLPKGTHDKHIVREKCKWPIEVKQMVEAVGSGVRQFKSPLITHAYYQVTFTLRFDEGAWDAVRHRPHFMVEVKSELKDDKCGVRYNVEASGNKTREVSWPQSSRLFKSSTGIPDVKKLELDYNAFTHNTLFIHVRLELEVDLSIRALSMAEARHAAAPAIVRDLLRAQESGMACDYGLIPKASDNEQKTPSEAIMVHKAILVLRAPGFDRMLAAGGEESRANSIELKSAGAEAVRMFVQVVYTDCLSYTPHVPPLQTICEFLELCGTYGVDKGMAAASELLRQSVEEDSDRLEEVVKIAQAHGLQPLVDAIKKEVKLAMKKVKLI
jgi:hypothetical protein